MLLDRALQRNPGLLAAAVELHQSGEIPAATFMVDLDAVAENARLMADEAARLGLRVFVMTKQHGRNPYINHMCLAQGLDATVAVETLEARMLHRFQTPIGHVGHLSNVPMNAVDEVVGMDPEYITVFTYESAKFISDAATSQGKVQDLYVRVNKPGDEVFRGMVGGWLLDQCVDGIAPILDLPGVRVAGLTQFPCLSYSTKDPGNARPTTGFETLLRAKETLERELSLSDLRVNAPGVNNTATFGVLAANGATDVEPGAGVTGCGMPHAYHDLPEKPAQVYVTEVMHHWDGETYTLGGGGTYIESFGGHLDYPLRCMIGSTFDEAKDNFFSLGERGVLDYHLVAVDGKQSKVGDTAVWGFHPQYFANRAYVAIVTGISRGEPKVAALFDGAVNALDAEFAHIPPADVLADIEKVVGGARVAG
jgi:predicted amino acid racemase